MAQGTFDLRHVFLTKNAVCGELLSTKLTKVLLTETFLYRNSELERAKVLLLTPAGVALIKAIGTFIDRCFNISVKTFGKHLPPLRDKIRSMLRNKLLDVKGMIIEKISMVSNDLLLHIHLRLVENFACPKSTFFQELQSLPLRNFYSCLQ